MSVIDVIVPAATTNLVSNSSFETNTSGWSTTSATLTRTAGAGVFGSYGGRLLASGTNGKASFTTGAVASGASVPLSMWVRATSASVSLKGTIGATNASQAHPGDGEWHRLYVVITAPSLTTPVLEIIDGRSSAWTNVDIDAAQVEAGATSPSTYVDGDQDGCSWTGTVHGSTSTRSGRDGRGGSITTISTVADVKNYSGIGAPDMNVATTSLAYTDGEVFTRQTAKPRVLMLPVLLAGANLAALHAQRRGLLDLLNPDTRDGRTPIRLRYTGAAAVKTIDGYLETGLGFDLGNYTQRNEMALLRFLCPDPFWYSETESQASLTAQLVSNVGLLAYRDTNGAWSSMAGGLGTTSTTATIQIWDAVKLQDGRIVVAGVFPNMGGVAAADNLAVYDPVAGTWAALGGVTPSADVRALAVGLDGTLYLGGSFTNLNGNASSDYVASYDPAANTFTNLSTGFASGDVNAMAIEPSTGYLWAIGSFTGRASYWNGSAWTTATTGAPSPWSTPCDIVAGPDGRMYACGGTSTAAGVYVWTGSTWSSIGASSTGVNIGALATSNSRLYAGGGFSTIGGVAANNIAVWNGVAWAPLGSGVGNAGSGGAVYSIAPFRDGQLIAGGTHWGTIGGTIPPDSLALWNGSTWVPAVINPPDTATHDSDQYRAWTFADDSMLVAWNNPLLPSTWGASLTANALTSVTNSGSANAYPVITLTSNGVVYSIQNLTTGQSLSFSNLSIATGEVATLDLRPGRKTFKAPTRDLRSYILPGSDLATFTLAPGVNSIAVYVVAGTATTRWRSRSWSAD